MAHIEIEADEIDRAPDCVRYRIERCSDVSAIHVDERARRRITLQDSCGAAQHQIRIIAHVFETKVGELACQLCKLLLKIELIAPCPCGQKLEHVQLNAHAIHALEDDRDARPVLALKRLYRDKGLK